MMHHTHIHTIIVTSTPMMLPKTATVMVVTDVPPDSSASGAIVALPVVIAECVVISIDPVYSRTVTGSVGGCACTSVYEVCKLCVYNGGRLYCMNECLIFCVL